MADNLLRYCVFRPWRCSWDGGDSRANTEVFVTDEGDAIYNK